MHVRGRMSFALTRPVAGRMLRSVSRLLVAASLTVGWSVARSFPVAAADIRLEPRPLLGGHVRAGSWAGVVVTVRNTGPAVTGELRLTNSADGRTSYGSLVDLPTNSVKEYALYAQPAIFRTTFDVLLVSAGQTLASASVPIVSHEPATP